MNYPFPTRAFLYDHDGQRYPVQIPAGAYLTLPGDERKLVRDFIEDELGLGVIVIAGQSYYKILECCEA